LVLGIRGQELLLSIKMTIEDFISKLEVEFEDVEPGTLKSGTSFRDIEDWSSMHALIVIALIDTEYDVILSGTDLQAANTISDLFELVRTKK